MKSFIIGGICAIVVAAGIVFVYSYGSISQVDQYAGDVVHVGTDQHSRDGSAVAGVAGSGEDNPDRAALVD